MPLPRDETLSCFQRCRTLHPFFFVFECPVTFCWPSHFCCHRKDREPFRFGKKASRAASRAARLTSICMCGCGKNTLNLSPGLNAGCKYHGYHEGLPPKHGMDWHRYHKQLEGLATEPVTEDFAIIADNSSNNSGCT